MSDSHSVSPDGLPGFHWHVWDHSENGKHLAVSTSDLSLHLLSASSLSTIWQLKDTHAFPSTCLAFSPKGNILASGSADMSLRLVQVGEQLEPPVVASIVESELFLQEGRERGGGPASGSPLKRGDITCKLYHEKCMLTSLKLAPVLGRQGGDGALCAFARVPRVVHPAKICA